MVYRAGQRRAFLAFPHPRTATQDREAPVLNNSLNNHLVAVTEKLQLGKRQLRRVVNLPTPLVMACLNNGPTDIGLHVVNDEYNGMLVTFTYRPGRYGYTPRHFQYCVLKALTEQVAAARRSVVCKCRDRHCAECGGTRCYSCFSADCSDCCGTGWKDLRSWVRGGWEIDYSSGFPIALVHGT